MANENKKSVLEEAVLEMQSILEAADKNAKNKIAKELPEKFETLLNEEIKKLKNKESVYESAKDKKEEPDNTGKKEDTDNKKESQKDEMNEMDMREMSIEEVEEAYENASDEDLFETINVDDIAQEIDQMEGMQNEVEHMQKESAEPNDPYAKLRQLHEMMSQMINEMDDAKMHEELHEKFDSHMKEMYGEGYTNNMGEEKCNELYEMYKESKKGKVEETKKVNESEEMNGIESEIMQGNVSEDVVGGGAILSGVIGIIAAAGGIEGFMRYLKAKKPDWYNTMAGLGSAAGNSRQRGMGDSTSVDSSANMNEDAVGAGTILSGVIGIIAAAGGIEGFMRYLKAKKPDWYNTISGLGSAAGNSRQRGMGDSNSTDSSANNNMGGITEEEEECGDEIDENLINTHGAQRKVQGGKNPSIDVAGKHREDRMRPAMREGQDKKLKSLMEENKKLSKQLIAIKSDSSDLESTNETYKGVLQKYRNQLQEMAVLNTNIAHVNNLLIKEGNLSIDEKKIIVNKFKSVETITESDEVFKGLLSEMVNKKKDILDEGINDKNIEQKFNDSIDPSSSKKITEQIVEKTALGNAHLNKIKSMMNYAIQK